MLFLHSKASLLVFLGVLVVRIHGNSDASEKGKFKIMVCHAAFANVMLWNNNLEYSQNLPFQTCNRAKSYCSFRAKKENPIQNGRKTEGFTTEQNTISFSELSKKIYNRAKWYCSFRAKKENPIQNDKKKVSQPNKILFQFPSKERKSHLKQLKNKGISKQETFYFSF